MNILSKLPFMNQTEEEAAEIDEAQAKKDRIAFHRDHVRNGPSNFKTVTNGQVKRAKVRALKAETKKARRRQVRAYLANQRQAATVRGHLQAAGVLPFFTEDYTATPEQALRSIMWIVARFAPAQANGSGEVEVTNGLVAEALTAALNFWQDAVGYPRTKLSPAYVLPVSVQA